MFESAPSSLLSTDETLSAEEKTVDFQELADELAKLAAQLDAGRYRFLTLVQRIDEHGGFADGGFRSTAHYLSWKANLDIGAAREQVRVARALPGLPRIADAFRQGQLSYSKVRALTRVATAENEEDLLTMALDASTAQLERIVRATRRVLDAAKGDDASMHERRTLDIRREWDGCLRIDARLPPARNIGQRRADALVHLARSALDHQLQQGANADRMQIVLREEPTSQQRLTDTTLENIHLADGTRLSPDTARRLCCDISVVEPDARKRRTPNAAQRRALADRHRCCAFPGCTQGHYLQAHHIEHWADGGETKLDNLVLLCSFHHHLVHEGGFGLRRVGHGGVAFHNRRGKRLAGVPERPPLVDTEDAIARLEESLRAEGIIIDAETNLHGGGGGFDLGWAVELVLAASGAGQRGEHSSR